ncbi:hypothetical protein PM082_022098 [Marasmius tenuissimus]|nr:hypothetical protein PM082_022098 [Marasmius tenuissimus]
MSSRFFHRATNTRFGNNTVLQHVGGDVNHNYFNYSSSCEKEEDQIMPRQNDFREFFKGDINLQELTWSEETEAIIRVPPRDNRPYQRDVETKVKVIKKFHTATIFQHGDQKFTVVTFEPKDKRNKEIIRLLWQAYYKAYAGYKSPRLIQMLGLIKSEIPTFILHEELANGLELHDRYLGNSIVSNYLGYTQGSAIERLRVDNTLPIEISISRMHWNLNLRTRSWQYDASTSRPLGGAVNYTITSLQLPGPNFELNAKEIITCFEQTFGDCLYLHALSGVTWADLSSYVQNSLLTFGTVVNYWGGGTFAHLSSIPSPKWSFEDYSHGMKASYSTKGPSRVDWLLHGAHSARLRIHFSLCFTPHERIRLSMAYLCQSHLIAASNGISPCPETVLIDRVNFSLNGDFLYDPTIGPTPAYLFVPRFWVNSINGMFCTYLPPPEALFYWASDPNGSNVIPEKDWERYKIPRLKVRPYVGSSWATTDHDFVRHHLHRKGYEEDGARYARDHGYPELILGDPHDASQIQELSERMDQVNLSPLQPQFFSPSTSSFDTPLAFQTSDIPPFQTAWSTAEGFNPRKRSEVEHSSGPGPAKRTRVAPLELSAHFTRRSEEYHSFTRPSSRSFGKTTFAGVAQQPKFGGLDSHGGGRIREWDHRQFEFEMPSGNGWNENGYSTVIGGNDGQSCDSQWSFGFLG